LIRTLRRSRWLARSTKPRVAIVAPCPDDTAFTWLKAERRVYSVSVSRGPLRRSALDHGCIALQIIASHAIRRSIITGVRLYALRGFTLKIVHVHRLRSVQ
jgi:hypothetical protein